MFFVPKILLTPIFLFILLKYLLCFGFYSHGLNLIFAQEIEFTTLVNYFFSLDCIDKELNKLKRQIK